MKRSNLDMSAKGLNVYVADGTESHSTTGLEPMDQSLTFQFRFQLLFNGEYRLGRDILALEFAFIFNHIPEQQLVGLCSLDGMAHQHPFFRQRMLATSTDFGQSQSAMPKDNQVPIAGNVQIKRIAVTYDFAGRTGVKQFRMNGTPKQHKIQIGDFWANG